MWVTPGEIPGAPVGKVGGKGEFTDHGFLETVSHTTNVISKRGPRRGAGRACTLPAVSVIFVPAMIVPMRLRLRVGVTPQVPIVLPVAIPVARLAILLIIVGVVGVGSVAVALSFQGDLQEAAVLLLPALAMVLVVYFFLFLS